MKEEDVSRSRLAIAAQGIDAGWWRLTYQAPFTRARPGRVRKYCCGSNRFPEAQNIAKDAETKVL
ncbi:hypothetical protein [Vannielia sp.]|uniref:hypothetical protein n=1 Tax=Vannielia sp. TaxID=2813045 RepID=UPI002604F542|nr:hypothetical protein [Vannielia sp.]MDF1871973.1 hypothetical protein [Vannielia sp.]